MAISDLQGDYTLVSEWNNCLDSANNMMNFGRSSLIYIQELTSDINYASNASAQEIQYINNLQTFIQNFMAQMPSNPG